MNDKARPVKEANDFRIGPVKRQTNYGTITIDWGNASNPEKRTKVILTAKGPKQEVLYQHSVDINTLKNK